MKRERWSGEFKFGLAVSVIVVLVSVLSLVYTRFGYNDMSSDAFLPPNAENLLGTDNLGRDIFTRVVVGGRYTLTVALFTVAGSALIGSVLGLTGGYIGGIYGEVVMRLMDAISSFPGLLLALVTVAIVNIGDYTVVIALIILFVPQFTRITRSGILQYKNADFVQIARIIGTSHARIIFVHILPNIIPSLVSAVIIALSNSILAEASLSYLGLGIQPPIPSWGRMMSESQLFFARSVWCVLAPGLAIMLTVMGFHYLGEGIRRRYSR